MSIDIGKILSAIGEMASGGGSEFDKSDRYERAIDEIRIISRHEDDAEGRLRAVHEICSRVLGRGHRRT